MGRPKKSDIQKHQKITPKKKKREEEFTDEVADDEEYEAKDMTKSTTPSQRPPRYRKPPKIFEFDHEKIRKLSDLFQKCYSIISTIKSHPWSWPFIEPVDPVVLNLPDYFIVITKPMDLGTVSKKILQGQYETIQDFAEDVRLVWKNCFTYNPPESDIVKMAQSLDAIFEEKFKKVVNETTSETYQRKIQLMEQKLMSMEKELKTLKPDSTLLTNSPTTQQQQQTYTLPTTTTTTSPHSIMPYVEKQKKKKPPKPLDSRPMTNEEKKRIK